MVLLLEKCAKILGCPVWKLKDRFRHPTDREILLNVLHARQVRTTYNNRNGFRKIFFIGGMSHLPAESLLAYGKLCRPYNCNVCAHYYSRHRIRLRYPFFPCIIERFPPGCEDRFYPLELLELVEDEDEEEDAESGGDDLDNSPPKTPRPPPNSGMPNWLGNMFAEISTEKAKEQCGDGSFEPTDAMLRGAKTKRGCSGLVKKEYEEEDCGRNQLSQDKFDFGHSIW